MSAKKRLFQYCIMGCVFHLLFVFCVGPVSAGDIMKGAGETALEGQLIKKKVGGTQPAKDLILYTAKIMEKVLGTVGIIGMIILISGGFAYLTSGGQQQRVEMSRKIMIYAGLGLVVIFGAYVFSKFAVDRLVKETVSEKAIHEQTQD